MDREVIDVKHRATTALLIATVLLASCGSSFESHAETRRRVSNAQGPAAELLADVTGNDAAPEWRPYDDGDGVCAEYNVVTAEGIPGDDYKVRWSTDSAMSQEAISEKLQDIVETSGLMFDERVGSRHGTDNTWAIDLGPPSEFTRFHIELRAGQLLATIDGGCLALGGDS